MDADPPRLYAPPSGFTRLRLTVAWDGRDFAGWQEQRNAASVQATLQAALEQIGGQGALRPVAAGRTDAGVHAEAMPLHWDVPQTFRVPLPQLPRALNARLPGAVSVLAADLAPPGFHARFSCTERRYVYRLWVAPQRHPLWAGRALHVPGPLNAAEMNRAAHSLLGLHDFAAFATREDRQTVRDLLRLDVQVRSDGHQGGELWEIHVAGESFLRHMVRGLVGTLLLVGQGKLAAAEVRGILASRERAQAGANVPPGGLYFTGAEYGVRRVEGRPRAGQGTEENGLTAVDG
ncbi:tRNA pseudouridine(38-40) synthase TruA [Deinococcus wulumuqiensis]|uniref:tRNA pseudouridine synthase A n=1 Tax=Deinococcus wulumuqiensis TaxID=980427 RepID=A0A345IHW2_9DEIO|nr:tRNA pseudouridine(38-40) synthase TruA [Deinococcus wulumuqiensis]AXG99284.1 tRNA pseudouridine(38-40) synthase TruA [Deinococcus wulumuqiensis]